MNMQLMEENKQYTYDSYLDISDDKRYEVIEGELFMVPAPNTFHQDYLLNIVYSLRSFVKERELGKIFCAPTDVILSNNIVVQPDILFISAGRKGIIEKKGIFGKPDLVVEIVSPSTFVNDTITKKDIYERFEVEEFWLVFPEEKVVEVFSIEEKRYSLYSNATEKGKVTSRLLKGFGMDLNDIFES